MDTDQSNQFYQQDKGALSTYAEKEEMSYTMDENTSPAGTETNVVRGMLPQIPEHFLPYEADSVLCWLNRLPIETNHPRSLLGSYQVKIRKSGEAMVLLWNEKLPDAFKKLIIQGFSSAPVLDMNNKFLGFIDLLDITMCIVAKFGRWKTAEKLFDQSQTNTYWNRYITLTNFKQGTVMEVMNSPAKQARTYLNCPVYKGFSTLYPMEFMAKTFVHAIPVLNKDNKVVNILTKSMLISLFAQNIDKFPSIRNHPVSTMIPGLSSSLITCKENELAIDCFTKMVKNNIRGLPVLNESGIITENISARDLRAVGSTAENYYRLWLSVKEFKQIARNDFNEQTPNQPIYLTKEDKFEDVVRRMKDGNIHRVYIVQYKDFNPYPLYVITQTDVLRFLLQRMGLLAGAIENE